MVLLIEPPPERSEFESYIGKNKELSSFRVLVHWRVGATLKMFSSGHIHYKKYNSKLL